MKYVECQYCDDEQYGNNGEPCPHCNYEEVVRSKCINWEPEINEYNNMEGE